jgi:hypothetical protein
VGKGDEVRVRSEGEDDDNDEWRIRDQTSPSFLQDDGHTSIRRAPISIFIKHQPSQGFI